MAFVDQYKLRTIVKIEENDSFTTNLSSSCFTSPSIDSSPPAIRRLQTLSLAPRPAYDLWNSGIYSPPDTNANESTTLNRKLTLNSDSGRESDSSFCSENELSPPIKRYTTHALTIYQLEKAKQQSSTLPRLNEKKARNSHTVSTKIFINEDEIPKPGQKQPLFEQRAEETDPSSTVLKIYIPPAVEKNVADRIAKHKEALAKAKTPFHMNVQPPHSKTQEHIVTPKYGVDSSGYRVVAWENEASRTPGRIADFKPEVDRVDRWHNEKSGAEAKRGSQSSIASSSLLTSVIVGAESPSLTPSETQIEYFTINCNPPNLQVDEDLQDIGNTLSDISSCTSSEASDFHTPASNTHSIKSASTGKSTKGSKDSTEHLSHVASKSSISISQSSNTSKKEEPPVETTTKSLSPINKTIRISEATDNMLQDRIVEVGLRPWKSQSVEQFTNRPVEAPYLIAEKSKKKVIFPSDSLLVDQQQHVYENIDDCREKGVEHPRKILPLPAKRLPFRQPARVPVFSIPKSDPILIPSKNIESFEEVGPDISIVSYRFYDRNMKEQNSLSQRCSAQLLRKSAMRISLGRSHSKPNSDRKQNNTTVQLNQTPIKSFSTNHSIEPLRYKIATDRTERTIGQLKNRVEDDPLITVNGKQRCVNCSLPLSRGQAMTIDSLGLFFHLHCFRCSDCGTLLSSGNARGMDVRVAGTKIQCNQCYNFANANVHYSQI